MEEERQRKVLRLGSPDQLGCDKISEEDYLFIRTSTKPIAMLTAIIENLSNLETSGQEVIERVQTPQLICDDPIPGSG